MEIYVAKLITDHSETICGIFDDLGDLLEFFKSLKDPHDFFGYDSEHYDLEISEFILNKPGEGTVLGKIEITDEHQPDGTWKYRIGYVEKGKEQSK